MKLLGFFLLCCLPMVHAAGQTETPVKAKKNFNRLRYPGEFILSKAFTDSILLTGKGTNISYVVHTNSRGDRIKEQTEVDGKYNGLAVSYWPNGLVETVEYYYENNLWEVISWSDSTGQLHNPGTLRNGNGVVNFYDPGGNSSGNATYTNGNLSGPYLLRSGSHAQSSGNLVYKPSSVNYLPAKKVAFIGVSGDTVSEVFNYDDYNTLFIKEKIFSAISVREDSLRQLAQEYPYIQISFTDPAVIPVGHWVLSDPANGRVLVETDYDDNGNIIQLVMYGQSGEIVQKQSFPPCQKRKIVKRNNDGSFYGEFCEDPMKSSHK